jgi:hypothetical protein
VERRRLHKGGRRPCRPLAAQVQRITYRKNKNSILRGRWTRSEGLLWFACEMACVARVEERAGWPKWIGDRKRSLSGVIAFGWEVIEPLRSDPKLPREVNL